MVTFMIEIPTEECLQRCINAAKKYIAAYDDLEKHDVGINVVIQAVQSDNVMSLRTQHGLKASTVATLLHMSLSDLVENRRVYYKIVVENLTPLVASQKKESSQLNPTLILDNYRETDSNSAALQMAKEVIYSPGKREHNPFLLVGDFGCGKTHLVNAIGNALKNENLAMTILYVTGDEFKRQYMDAVKSNKLVEFKDRYDKVDVLILDNLQDLVGPGTQNCFFHVMDQMYQKDKQMVLTCNQGLGDLKGVLEARIIEHLRWGTTIEIGKLE